jgi:lysyl-tRNA synthetase class 2
MASIEELKQVRLEKINKIRAAGVDPYPISVDKTHSLSDLSEKFGRLSIFKKKVTVVGRIMSLRGQGAVAFVDLYDGSGRFQAFFKKQDVSDFKFFKEVIDESDFIQVTGKLFKTKKGQKTIAVTDWKIVAKSLQPIPDEFYGLKDEDDRYRRRYIDILLSQETREMVERKSVFWNSFREFLLKRDFTEVQTPVLENTTGGADARPFVTHHNALDMDVYLRISAGELWQKKLMVAGIPKTFEIGRIFRNEGMSNEHLQDYTQIEFYEAYSDYEKGMKMIQDLYKYVAKKTFGTTKFEISGKQVDLAKKWERYDFVEILQKRFGVDAINDGLEKIVDVLKENKINFDTKINKEKAVDTLWKSIRGEYVGPGFLINIPIYLEPLAKKNPENQDTVQRFQVVLGGSEMGKGFSELNDPVDQAQRFERQEILRQQGDDEAQMKDTEYVEAMEFGMPPSFGFGISERLFSVLSGKSVRETTIFPLMRPKD